jgi:hypothetical protein
MPFELDERFIIAAEEKLGASLPYSYRQAMRASNGSRVLALRPFAVTGKRYSTVRGISLWE